MNDGNLNIFYKPSYTGDLEYQTLPQYIPNISWTSFKKC